MLKFIDYILVYGALWLWILDGDSLILLDVTKVDLLHVLSYHYNPLIRLVILGLVIRVCIFLLLVRFY